jgi:phosphoglycolate phosphatase
LSRFSSILFDFDYTLADSSPGVLDCANHALEGLGLPTTTREDVNRTIGLSLPETLVHLAGEEYRWRSGEFHRLFVERANEVMADFTTVFVEATEVIASLRGEGISLGIVSTKFRYRIEAILSREGLLDLFDVIVGGEDVERHKPDPEGLLTAIKRLGCSVSEALYIGDSVIDAEAARRARVPFVAVLSGKTPMEAFKGYEAHGIIRDLKELPSVL